MDINNPKFTGPIETRELLRDEYGVEAYYNFAITPWMKLTPNIQFVRGAQKETVKVESLLPPVIHKEDVKTATVLGLRLQMIF
jgi:carbohydrate-selective porin OprB